MKKVLAVPFNYHVFFTASSLEAMERILQNCVYRQSFHFVNGAFSQKFYDFAWQLGLKAEKTEATFGQGFDFEKIKIPRKTELICLAQNETSSGVALPMAEVYQLKKLYPDKLIALDIVSSAPYVKIDFSKIDLAFFSVQKGFGLPAGLAVLLVNNEAMAKAKFLAKKKSIGTYHSFLSFLEYAKKGQSPETPNVLGIYLLGKVTEDMLKKGIGQIRQETEKKSKMIYNFFDQHQRFKPFVKNENYRSKTTIVIDAAGRSKEIGERLKEKGAIIGRGYGKFKDQHIRLVNFPSQQINDVKTLLKLLESIDGKT